MKQIIKKIPYILISIVFIFLIHYSFTITKKYNNIKSELNVCQVEQQSTYDDLTILEENNNTLASANEELQEENEKLTKELVDLKKN